MAFFPLTHSLLAVDALAQALEKHYGLSTVRADAS
jgi:hypothetical protein